MNYRGYFMLLIFLVMLVVPHNAIAQTYGSQIVMARKANLIIIGEVEYLAHQPSTMFTAAHVLHQTVVFRVHEVLKGNYSEKFIKVGIQVGRNTGLNESIFRKENRFILLLERPEDSKRCYEWKTTDGIDDTEPSPEFEKYNNAPCFYIYLDAAIDANEKEIEAIKWLIESTGKRK